MVASRGAEPYMPPTTKTSFKPLTPKELGILKLWIDEGAKDDSEEEAEEEQLDWIKPWDKILEWSYESADIKWFLGGKINVSFNCIDRHLESRRSLFAPGPGTARGPAGRDAG